MTTPTPRAAELRLYPRHFGVTFREGRGLRRAPRRSACSARSSSSPSSTRFEGLVEVHRTFVLRDPSDNLIEFKHYTDPRMMY